MRLVLIVLCFCTTCAGGAAVLAQTARVAVATNFVRPMQEIVARLEESTGHRYLLSSGSTGKLYAQIASGAPFDVFLAADAARPTRLEREGWAVPGSRFTYALGRLWFWTAAVDVNEDWFDTMLNHSDVPIAIANERLAPYGVAALEVLASTPDLAQRQLLRGENVGHAFTLVATGHAPLGLVAAASVVAHGGGTSLEVAPHLHAPIRQDAVVLRRAEANAAVMALREWFATPAAASLLLRWGYEPPARPLAAMERR